MDCAQKESTATSFYGLPIIEKNTFLHFEKSITESSLPQRRQSAPHLGYSSTSSPIVSPRSNEDMEQSQCITRSLDLEGTVGERFLREHARQGQCEDIKSKEEVCTVMIKNIPCSCKKQDVINAVAELGFVDVHNFFYVPTRHGKTIGYAFIGFSNPELTKEFSQRMTGYRFVHRNSQKVVEIVPASIQGVDNTWEHFKDTSVMQTPSKPSFPSRGSSR
eukprot:CAMPEP_0169124116 /NCGR_PEP_ID=MMETSP1015-20121227/34149_1 /TAXON_ID=342587 /ORGANISM="Karlodinium micrum, Strain CCMP2283" /LENGTH=218 /DNA_ID=CAMNT_0009187503 /DNA_START=57 /DNA_END=713 /DNA_ORIENTATION=-